MNGHTSFCLQYSSSAQQSSFLILSAGQLGLGVIADIEDVTTTRRTPSFFAAVSTLMVPLIAGSNNWRCNHQQMLNCYTTNRPKPEHEQKSC